MAQNTGTLGVSAEKMGDESAATEGLPERLRAGLRGAFFRPIQVEEAGITRHQLRTLVRHGVVEHVARGLYRFADAEPTERYSIAMACARVPKSIVCLLSALSVHEIGTQLPHEVWLAIPHKAEPPRVPGIKVRLLRFSGAAWSYGIQEIEFEGVPARITSPARTVVDCFRFERLIGREAALEALHDALRQRKVSMGGLIRVMEVLPNRRLHAALEGMAP
jgi:predicted transcriptional regulator of viral defense system